MQRLLVAVLLAALPGASAHGTFEANELEVHLIEDEGTDVMQEYGGYDINELFLGAAHDPLVGQGSAGDGFYFRLEAYGEILADRPPSATGPWRLVFHFTTPNGTQQRTLSTEDGVTFASDFSSMLVATGDLELHVLRAFVAFDSINAKAGDTISGFRVESFVGDDLRDAAPGPLYLPGTGGRVPYDDPTALPGRGTLVEATPLGGPGIYLKEPRLSGSLFDYTIQVDSALKGGAQHVMLVGGEGGPWTYDVSAAMSVTANGTATFKLRADPHGATGPLLLDLRTDVGGRIPVTVHSNGTIQAGLESFVPPVPLPEESPAWGIVAVLVALGCAWASRRNRKTP